MQQSKKFRKVLAVLMVIAMLFSIATPAMAALISGESFTVNVVKVVDGNAVATVTLTEKCRQSTGHSGYNHSTNLYDLAKLSGFTGYKGYNWSKYTTVPSSYTPGLASNNNYAAVHYNITGSAPYKADETLFLFFESTKYSYTVNHVYRTNGIEDGRTTTTVSDVLAGTTVSVSSISEVNTYKGNTYRYTRGTPTSATINGDGTTFTLYYDRYKYAINYDTQGGSSVAPTTKSSTNTSETLIVTAAEPTKQGSTFLGWAISANATSPDTVKSYTLDSKSPTMTLYAVWQQLPPDTYTVTYTDGVEGEEIFADQVTSNLPSGTATPAFNGTPSREGYVFKGWNPEVATIVTGNATYTATWKEDENKNGIADEEEEKYTVTYTDGVEGEEIFADQVTNNLLSGTATPAFNGTPSREGYVFKGWNPVVATTVTGNATYTAIWKEDENKNGIADEEEEKYTVTYTDGVEGEEIFADQVTNNLLSGTATPAFNGTPSREGYVFKGWNPVVAATVTANVIYTAIWEQESATNWSNLSISKTADKTTVNAGEKVTYKITVANNTGVNLTGIEVSEKLDSNLTFVSAVPSGQYDATNGVWNIAALGNGETATLTITAKAKDDVADGTTTIPNTATITAASDTSDGVNNLPSGTRPSANVDITVNNGGGTDTPTDWSELTVNKTVAVVTGSSLQFILDNPGESILPDAKVTTGSNLLYTITVSNDTGKDLTGIKVSEKLDSNLTFVSAEPSDQYNVTEGLWTIEQLADKAQAVLHILVVVKDDAETGAKIANTATITAAQADDEGLPESNQPSDTVTVTVDEKVPTEPDKDDNNNNDNNNDNNDDNNNNNNDNNGNNSDNSGSSNGGYDGEYSDVPSTPVTPTAPIEDTKVPLADPKTPQEEQTDRDETDAPQSEQLGEPVEIAEPQVPLGDAPKTGDAASAAAYAGLLVVAACGLVITRRKYN